MDWYLLRLKARGTKQRGAPTAEALWGCPPRDPGAPKLLGSKCPEPPSCPGPKWNESSSYLEIAPALVPGAAEGLTMETHKREMELLSNSMAAYAHIRDNPESFGLYFVLGVCFGLILTLCLLVIHISWRPQAVPSRSHKSLRHFSEDDDEDDEEEEEDEEEDTIDHGASDPPLPMTELPLEPPSTPDGTLTVNVFASAEELERAQRLEERERILREIWRNGQPDVLGTGAGTIGRVHYY